MLESVGVALPAVKRAAGRSAVLDAVDWVLSNRAAYNLRVVTMSFGTAAVESYRNDPLCVAVRRLVDAGIVVVVSAGNHGKDASGARLYGGINSPGIEPSAITVGAANTFGTDSRDDDGVATFSSRGPTRGYWTDEVPEAAQKLIDAFWPGPLTLILKRASHIDAAVAGGQDSIGLRCPSHPVAQALLARF